MDHAGGDWEAYLHCLGVSWIRRKAAGMNGYGVGAEVTIDQRHCAHLSEVTELAWFKCSAELRVDGVARRYVSSCGDHWRAVYWWGADGALWDNQTLPRPAHGRRWLLSPTESRVESTCSGTTVTLDSSRLGGPGT